MATKAKTRSTLFTISSILVSLIISIIIVSLTLRLLQQNVQAHADVIYRQGMTVVEKYSATLNHASSKDVTNSELCSVTDGSSLQQSGHQIDISSVAQQSLNALGADGKLKYKFLVKDDNRVIYVIEEGDTLSSISAALGYSVDELANYNQIRNVHLIYADSALRIPLSE